jgi:CheY-like chemotaxis protein
MLTNLVGSAIKFTTHGRVSVQVGRYTSPDAVRVFVEDTGLGIAADTLPRLFEPFRQADSTTTRRFGGSGLGPEIVRRLCELMGGSCGAESTVGVGSRFWRTLPMEVPTAPLVSAPARDLPVRPATTRAPLHVLVAEDDAINQVVTRGFPRTVGHTCTIVENGREVVDAVRGAHAYDLVIMDWQMPEVDGLEATRRIRRAESGSGRRIPIVALTANALVGERERCRDAGMDDFLSAPFQLRDLDALLERWRPGATAGAS